MPRHKKASVRAKAKRQSGQSIFTHVEEDISEHGSVYNDSGEEEIWSDEDELDAAHTEDSLESIASLQRLYAVFLPPHLKQQNLVSSCLCPYISIYLPVNSQAKKAKISNRSVVYWKDSHTSDWRKRKHWKGASKGCQKLDSFFSVSHQTQKLKTKWETDLHVAKKVPLTVPRYTPHVRE